MSASNRTAGPSTDSFATIFNAATSKYQRMSGKRLDTHPFASELETCHNPEAILTILQTQAQAFMEFRQGDETLMACLGPTVRILFRLSEAIGIELVGHLFLLCERYLTSDSQPFSKTVVTAIAVLLKVSLPKLFIAHRRDIRVQDCERCCRKPQHSRPPLRACPHLPSTSELLHWNPTHERNDGVIRGDYGAITFPPRTLDQGDDGLSNQWVDIFSLPFLG